MSSDSGEASVVRWADVAMYRSEPMPQSPEGGGVSPSVYVLQCTPDPLGSIAAFAAMYKGEVIRDKGVVTDAERRYYLSEMQKTKLKAPLEAVTLHFMVEGVTRSFTHQMVRQRIAVYAQESLRFSVKEDFVDEVAIPPSLASLPEDSPKREIWRHAVEMASDAYGMLVATGVPAEDARGLLPHAVTTRLNYHTNLRSLSDHAGVRLCTQAQFEWRIFWVRLLEGLRRYCTNTEYHSDDGALLAGELGLVHDSPFCDNWQWQEIANLFKPVCYLTGSCQFKADFDRACKIRDRVDAFESEGISSVGWGLDHELASGRKLLSIHPSEWLLDDGAARVAPSSGLS